MLVIYVNHKRISITVINNIIINRYNKQLTDVYLPYVYGIHTLLIPYRYPMHTSVYYLYILLFYIIYIFIFNTDNYKYIDYKYWVYIIWIIVKRYRVINITDICDVYKIHVMELYIDIIFELGIYELEIYVLIIWGLFVCAGTKGV